MSVRMARDLNPGDIIEWHDDFLAEDVEYREVRLVEPLRGSATAVLIVFAGGDTETMQDEVVLRLADPADVEKHRQAIRDVARRDWFRAKLMTLADMFGEAGLPPPWSMRIDGSCLDSHDAVRQAADVFGVEATQRPNGARVCTEAVWKVANPDAAHHDDMFSVRFWHLGAPEGGAAE